MKQEYKMFLALLIMILFLILYMPTVPTPAQAALPNKITNGTWVWAPEGPPTPGGVYWNYWLVLAAYIGAPYFQFGKYAEMLATVNTSNPALSSYLSNLTDYIEKLNVTPTSNGFYFPNVSTMNDEYMIWVANPYFEKAFPNSSVRYYPEMITYWSSSNTQTYNFLEAGLLGYCVTAIPYSIYETLKVMVIYFIWLTHMEE